MVNIFKKVKLKTLIESHDSGFWGDESIGNDFDITVIRSTNFSNDGILSLQDIAIRNFPKNKYIEKKLKYGDILIERSGGSDTQPVGRTGFIDQDMDDIYSFANFIERLRLSNDSCPKYVYYLLQQRYEAGETNSMQNQTTGIRNIDMKHYLNSFVNYAEDIEEQKRIAYVLDKTDEAIKVTQNTIEKTQRLKKSMMQNLLTGKMKPDGTWRKMDDFYVDPKFGKVPNGWEITKIGKLGEYFGGATPDTQKTEYWGGDIPFLVPSDISKINDSVIYLQKTKDYITNEGFRNCSTRRVPIGSLCISSRANIGDCVITIFEVCTNQGFINATFNTNVDTLFMYYLIKQNKQTLFKYSAGTTFPEIGRKSFKGIKLIIPKNKIEQEQISTQLKLFDIKLESLEEKHTKLQRLKKSLMQHLLTGKMRIPENTFDLVK